MKRLSFRFAAAALAVGVTAAELLGIARLAQTTPFTADAVVVLPRVVVTPAEPREAPGDSRQAAAFTVRLPRT